VFIVFASPVIISVILLLARIGKYIGAEWLDRKMYRSLEDPLPQKFMVILPKPIAHKLFDLSWVGEDVIAIVYEEHEVVKKRDGLHGLFDFSDVCIEDSFEECF